MSSQNIPTTGQKLSGQVSKAVKASNREGTAPANAAERPPGYAVFDPDGKGQRNDWPLGAYGAERPDSSMGYTSPGPKTRMTKAAKSPSRMFRVANSNSRTQSSSHDVQAPPAVIIAPERSNTDVPAVGSSGSFLSSLANKRAGGAQKKPGLLSSISHGDWTTIGSFFSSNPVSPQRPKISAPYNFRHEAGIGPGASVLVSRPSNGSTVHAHDHASASTTPALNGNVENSEQRQSSIVLMDMRSESRVGNRTSLPVKMPNVVSPINNTVFDTGCNSSVHASAHRTLSRFPSPPSPEVAVALPQESSVSPNPENMNPNANNGIHKRGNCFKVVKYRKILWMMALVIQIFVALICASASIIAYEGFSQGTVDIGYLVWLLLAIAGLIVSLISMAALYVRHLTVRVIHEALGGIFQEMNHFKMNTDRVIYWVCAMITEFSFLGVIMTFSIIMYANKTDRDPRRAIIGMIVCLLLVATFGSPLSFLRAGNIDGDSLRRSRIEQRAEGRDNDWIELNSRGHSLQSANRQPEPTSRAVRSASDGAELPMRFLLVDRSDLPENSAAHRQGAIMHHHNGTAAPQAGSRDTPMHGSYSQHPQGTPSQNRQASMIGLARSDSLLKSQQRVRHANKPPSTSSSATSTTTVETFESEGTEKPIMKKQSFPVRLTKEGGETTDDHIIYSAEAMSMVSLPQPTLYHHIPHSRSMADLSTETAAAPNPSASSTAISSSNTKSTISSLIGSYASEAGTGEPMTHSYSQQSLGRASECFTSHPVRFGMATQRGQSPTAILPAFQQPIVTEAGTPNSQKSIDRIGDGEGGDAASRTEWGVRDGMATRLVTMTPIEERSERGTRGSSLYGH
ncbi:hypothetical protein JX266_007657 [Neoarthrinium moseri]|nr:hypothetical protein JX266_007657 [Neoarthrinium moseri]